jgi:Holliday junction DNA helicase RuvA
MIGWLSGTLRAKHPPLLLLDVHGVGYELEAPMTTFYDLPAPGDVVSLYTHQVVREDAQLLYGFARHAERDLFRMLIRVSGVGPKLALGILSGMDASQFGRCVFEGDTASLVRLPGVGKKTAERLVIEMRDRLNAPEATASANLAGPADALVAPTDPQAEAVSALVALGYRPADAAQRVRGVVQEGMVCEDIIRLALQSMVR